MVGGSWLELRASGRDGTGGKRTCVGGLASAVALPLLGAELGWALWAPWRCRFRLWRWWQELLISPWSWMKHGLTVGTGCTAAGPPRHCGTGAVRLGMAPAGTKCSTVQFGTVGPCGCSQGGSALTPPPPSTSSWPALLHGEVQWACKAGTPGNPPLRTPFGSCTGTELEP